MSLTQAHDHAVKQPEVKQPEVKQPSTVETHHHFNAFVDTIAALRAPDGCPWDREQTHESIASNMIEEAYEAVDAIEAKDVVHLREELGDVLLQVVLQSQIASDAGEFTIDDVCADVNAKMIRRHPHVFGDVQASSAAEVLDLWDQVKLSESDLLSAAPVPPDISGVAVPSEALGHTSADSAAPAGSSLSSLAAAVPQNAQAHKSLLDSVPTSFPSLMQAQKISRKAAASGFEWDTLADVWVKVREEVAELEEAYAAAPKAANGKVDVAGASMGTSAEASTAALAAVEQEFGDVLFSLVNVARRMGIDSETALRATCNKFRRRWAFMEISAAKQGRRVEDLSDAQRESLWNAAKSQELEQGVQGRQM